MKRYLVVALFLLAYLSVYPQFPKKENGNEIFSFINYGNQRYTECQVRIFLLNQDRINLIINPKREEDSVPFEFYVELNTDKGQLPEGLHSFNDREENPGNITSRPFFVRIFKEWGNANRTYQARLVNLYIQKFEENYLISGWTELDTDNMERMDFIYYGSIKEEKIEVKKVSSYILSNYSSNQGKIIWNKETIDIPYAFQERKENKRRICLINKLLFMDRVLEYGIYFEFDSNKQLESGEYKSSDISNPFKAAFFNQGKTEYPTDTRLTVKYNKKKNEYVLNYEMNFPNNQTLKGSYKGKIPQDDF